MNKTFLLKVRGFGGDDSISSTSAFSVNYVDYKDICFFNNKVN